MYQKTKLSVVVILIAVLSGCMPPSQGSMEKGFSIGGASYYRGSDYYNASDGGSSSSSLSLTMTRVQ